MTIRDIQLAQQEKERGLEPVRDFTPAVLLYVDSTDLDAKAEGFPDFCWASEFNQPESAFKILNRATPPVVGLPVKIGYPEKPPFERQVLGVWDGIETLSGYTASDGGSLNTQPHAQSHQFPTESTAGTDPVLIYQPAVQMLKATGNATDLTVSVAALPSYRYLDTHKTFNGSTIDLTSSVPGVASTVRYVLVYLDATTNVLSIVNGTAVPDVPSITIPKPALPENGISSAYVELANGQTSITTATHVVDAREFLHTRDVNILSSATAAGQILISNDGITLELGIPVVDGNGDIVTDINGHIVVV
jgi:hypothetical protein